MSLPSFLSLIATLAILGLSGIRAQDSIHSFSASGFLLNNADEPVPYASVAAYSADSVLLGGTTSDDHGYFELLQPEATYLVIKFLSYDDLTIALDRRGSSSIDLGKLVLKPNAQLLQEFELVGEKSAMELHLDKRVYNVGKDLNNAGGTAGDILVNVPSVEVDAEGNVSLRGRENVRILIDGKPSALLGSDNNGLKMLQSSMIDRIEVITNPSARNEAQGETGIINIVLKKEQKKGFNGIFDVGGGYPWTGNTSGNVNFRAKNHNLFAGLGINYRQSPGRGFSENEYVDADTNYHFDNTSNRLRQSFSQSMRFGSDFFVGQHHTITLSSSIRVNESNNSVSISYRDLDGNQEVLHTTDRNELENESSTDLEGSLNYKRTFAQPDREWVTSFRFIDGRDLEKSVLDQISTIANEDGIKQRSSNVENEQNSIFQTDYIHPMTKGRKFELGARGSNRIIRNAFSVDVDSNNGEFVNLDTFTNEMLYNELIGAAYAMFSGKRRNFGYQLGLRGEYTAISTNLLKSNQVNNRSYLNPFPSLHLSYALTEKNSLQLSYSRRINRPSFRELIPFFSYSDSRNYFSGNPDLNPEFSHNLELGYLRTLGIGNLMTSVYYRNTQNVIERITITDSTGLIRRFPINLGAANSIGLETTWSLQIKRWWRLSGSANFYHSETSGQYGKSDFAYRATTLQGRAMSVFKLPRDVNFQVAGNYQAPRKSAQGTNLARYSVDLAMSKDVLRGNGTITLNCTDLFNSNKWQAITTTETLYSTNMWQMRMRYTSVNFSYRINQQKERAPRNSTMSNDGEMEM